MKHRPLLFIFSLLFLLGCQESSKKSSSSSNPYLDCNGNNYFTVPGCSGYCQTNPAYCNGATNGGTTGGANCSGQGYWTQPGCAGYAYCQTNPSYMYCTGGGGTNPYPQYSSDALSKNWGVQYPGGEPTGTCSPTYAPSDASYTPYETRKATMAIQGQTFYNPASSVASSYMNTSSILKSVNQAKLLFESDGILKVRFKPRAQPENTESSPYCYIPSYTKMSSVAGYTKLQYSVSLYGKRTSSGSYEEEPLGTFTTGVNSCTSGINLSPYLSTYPYGMYLVVHSVKENKMYTPDDYHLYGFKNMNSFKDVRSMDCWVLDIEVAADGTKTFD